MRYFGLCFTLVILALAAMVPSATAVKANAQVLAHLGMSQSTFMSAVAQLQQAREEAESGGLPQCGGLLPELCQPCPQGGPEEFCAAMQLECSRIFCNPMCKRSTWTCKMNFGNFAAENANKRVYEDALCTNFINHACANMLDCCAKDAYLYSEVEEKTYGNQYPKPYLPSPTCFHDPANEQEASKLCSKCNGQIKVEIKKKECNFPATPAFLELDSTISSQARASSQAYLDSKASGRALYEQMYTGLVHGNGAMPLEDLYAADEALFASIERAAAAAGGASFLETGSASHSSARARGGHAAAGSQGVLQSSAQEEEEGGDQGGRFGDEVEGFPGEAAYHGLQARCEAMTERITDMFGEMQSTFQAKACECLGCCAKPNEPSCFFPVTATIKGPPVAEKQGQQGSSTLEVGAGASVGAKANAKASAKAGAKAGSKAAVGAKSLMEAGASAKAAVAAKAEAAAQAEAQAEAELEAEVDAEEASEQDVDEAMDADADADAEEEGEADADEDADADADSEEELDPVSFLQYAMDVARAKSPGAQTPLMRALDNAPRMWNERARASPWYAHARAAAAAAAPEA